MNKRLERGLRILILLQSGADYDAMKLAREMKVTRRTIFRDIAMLKELGLTIDYDVDQSTYCVRVLDESGDAGNRRLDHEELGRALQQSLAGEIPATASSGMVIRQLALNLASANRNLVDVAPENVCGSSQVLDKAQILDKAQSGPMDSAAQSIKSGVAPQIGCDRDVETDRFEKQSKLIHFFVKAIDSGQFLRLWDRVEEKELCVVPSELRYSTNSWVLVATTKVGVVMTLPIGRLDFDCISELAK